MFTYICFARRLETAPEDRCICTRFAGWGIDSTFQMRSGFKRTFTVPSLCRISAVERNAGPAVRRGKR